ncbi:hypothetical protein LPJ62_004152 [Coemansia sp. RSA 2167]|nr:hypothetical protein LPJ62_004152 [Coemansia sp. RSA 2167]KAJ2147610.1 hypothetical protein J3F82_004821 [Coemansia sp. RSA 637]KAJ2723318.1 hypothetical protein H4S00_002533 [Coemansia sp. D1744]
MATMESRVGRLLDVLEGMEGAPPVTRPAQGSVEALLAGEPPMMRVSTLLDSDPDLAGFRHYTLNEDHLNPGMSMPIGFMDAFTSEKLATEATQEYVALLTFFTASLAAYVRRLQRNEPISQGYKQCLVDQLEIGSRLIWARVDKYRIRSRLGYEAGNYVDEGSASAMMSMLQPAMRQRLSLFTKEQLKMRAMSAVRAPKKGTTFKKSEGAGGQKDAAAGAQ